MSTIFFATSNMDFNVIARTKGDILEIDKIQLNQIVPRNRNGSVAVADPARASPRTPHELRVRLCLNTLCMAKSRYKSRSDSVFRQSVGDSAV